jgi:uncharacterized protein YukE
MPLSSPGLGMPRPPGEPGAVAAGSRAMSGAAGAVGDLARRLAATTSSVVAPGVWKGPASEAYRVDGAGSRAGLERAAASLDQAAAALAEYAARLEHAQATWDRAQRLAAVAGVDLDPAGGPPAPRPGSGPGAGPGSGVTSGSGVVSPVTAVDPAASLVAGQALRIAEAAGQEAAAARRVAAARLDQAAAAIGPAAASRGQAVTGTSAGSPGTHPPAAGPGPAARPGHGAEPEHEERHGRRDGPVERVVDRAMEMGAEAARATHHLVSAAEARVAAAARLAAVADNPAVRGAAGRVAETAGRPMLDGRIITALPLAAPVLDFTAAVRHGEPLPRALAGALGSAVGADLGGRLGLAACGGAAAATQGAGLIVCPTFTAVGGALGAEAGRAAFLHVYDELTEPSDTGPAPEGTVRPGPEPRPGG